LVKEKREMSNNKLRRITLPPVKFYLGTGCTLLDLAIANVYPGGFPGGRIIHIVGESSACKSVLCQTVLGYNQRVLKGKSIYEDSEMTLDFDRARKLFGLDVSMSPKKKTKNWKYNNPNTLEELFDTEVEKELKTITKQERKYSTVMAVDSITALPSITEMKNKLEDKSYGTIRAKKLSEACRKYGKRFALNDFTFIAVDHQKINISAGAFESSVAWSGGLALNFHATVRILLSSGKKIKNEYDKVIGERFYFYVDKNKIAPPFKSGEFRLLFDYGIDNIGTNLEFYNNYVRAKNKKKITKSRAEGIIYNKKKYKNLDEAIRNIEENNLEKELEEKIWKIWQKIYTPIERKERVW